MEIIIATHGDLAKGLIHSANLILGGEGQFKTISLQADDNIDSFEEKFVELMKATTKRPLVLVDMFGGSPFNISMKYSREYDYSVVTGVNLPMLIEASMGVNSEVDYDEFVTNLVNQNKEAIQLVKL